MAAEWELITADSPLGGVVVDTIIDDINGKRNHQPLVRNHRLWFVPDMSMYVYYTPTHWRDLLSEETKPS